MMDCKFSDTGSAAQSDFVPGSAYSALELCLRAIKPGRLTYSQRWQFFQKKWSFKAVLTLFLLQSPNEKNEENWENPSSRASKFTFEH